MYIHTLPNTFVPDETPRDETEITSDRQKQKSPIAELRLGFISYDGTF